MISYPVIANKETNTIAGRYNGEEFNDLTTPTFTIPDEFKYQVYVVDDMYTARPDLLSLHIYKTVNYADVLCKLNGVSNPFELNAGMIIIAPDIADLPKFYASPLKNTATEKTALTASGEKTVKSLQKKKNETRQANSSVIGDKNYKIDKNNKLIIY